MKKHYIGMMVFALVVLIGVMVLEANLNTYFDVTYQLIDENGLDVTGDYTIKAVVNDQAIDPRTSLSEQVDKNGVLVFSFSIDRGEKPISRVVYMATENIRQQQVEEVTATFDELELHLMVKLKYTL